MPYGMYLSAAGANVQNHRLEILSHNLANVNTPGFKPQLAMLQARHAEAVERGESQPGSGGLDDVGGGVQFVAPETLFARGPIQQTERPTDFAINDDTSFFAVSRQGQEMLTRDGGFLFNAQGVLTNSGGDPVLSTAGQPVRIDPRRDYQIHHDGRITQAGRTQMLRLVRPNSPGDLARVGDNLFRPLGSVREVDPSKRAVANGMLESSAVKPTAAMMELIEATRVYEANLRMIQHQDTALGGLIGRLLKDS